MRLLKEQGVATIFVSHKLEEVHELCNIDIVMRDGKHIITTNVKDLNKDQIIKYIRGQWLSKRRAMCVMSRLLRPLFVRSQENSRAGISKRWSFANE